MCNLGGKKVRLDDPGAVTCMLPVEVFATSIKMFDQQSVLITCSFPFEALDRLIFKNQKSNCSRTFLIR